MAQPKNRGKVITDIPKGQMPKPPVKKPVLKKTRKKKGC